MSTTPKKELFEIARFQVGQTILDAQGNRGEVIEVEWVAALTQHADGAGWYSYLIAWEYPPLSEAFDDIAYDLSVFKIVDPKIEDMHEIYDYNV